MRIATTIPQKMQKFSLVEIKIGQKNNIQKWQKNLCLVKNEVFDNTFLLTTGVFLPQVLLGCKSWCNAGRGVAS